jgi:hypothetical protein
MKKNISNAERKMHAISYITTSIQRYKTNTPLFSPDYLVASKVDDSAKLSPKFRVDDVVYDEKPKWLEHKFMNNVGDGLKNVIIDFSDLKTIQTY